MIRCPKCKYIYDPSISYIVPAEHGVHIFGEDPEEKVPRCPNCKHCDFYNIAARQIANDRRFA